MAGDESMPPAGMGVGDTGLLLRERAARTSSSTSVWELVRSNMRDTSVDDTVPEVVNIQADQGEISEIGKISGELTFPAIGERAPHKELGVHKQ